MKWLTKSDYLKYLIHPAYLWLQKHDKEKLPPFDDAVQAIVDAGNEIEAVARELFPKGVMVKSLFADSVRETEKYVKEGHKVIYQASVLTDRRLYARADVIMKNTDGSWDIYEIKSATKVKPEYIHDLAFQKVALEESTYTIRNMYIVHINSYYVRQGEINPKQLFVQSNVTEEVNALVNSTKTGIEKALEVIGFSECPDDSPAHASSWYGWRDTYRHLHPEIPATSIYNMTRLKPEQLSDLLKRDISDMLNIPDSFELGPQQKVQLRALKAAEPIVYPTKIAARLSKLKFPLYFFDYETVGPGLPMYNGTRPYQQIPFQYSLHILDKPGEKLRHVEFLATGSADPMPALLQRMQRDIGPEGSVIVWFKGFEMGVNDTMAEIYPEYGPFLKQVNGRIYDLMEVFSKFDYADAAFGGSASIKKVLPVLVPEMTYSNLEIQKGDVASKLWEQTAKDIISGEKAEKIYEDLRVYCGQDTLAMVRIYEVLLDLSTTSPGSQLSLLG